MKLLLQPPQVYWHACLTVNVELNNPLEHVDWTLEQYHNLSTHVIDLYASKNRI